MRQINITCTEQSLEGRFLANLIHSGTLDALLKRDEFSFALYESGEHILTLSNPRQADVEALLALISESCSAIVGCEDFITHLKYNDKLN